MKFSDYRKSLAQDKEFLEAKRELLYALALGDAVLRARLEKGWSQSEVARRAGTKQANISRIEAGLANPTLKLIQDLCQVLSLEIIYRSIEEEQAEITVATPDKYLFRIEVQNEGETQWRKSFDAQSKEPPKE